MDTQIGRLLGTLEALGLRENTLIIFASDNGVAVMAPREELGSGANLKGRKGQLYEGGIKVPLIVNMPGRVPARSVNNLVYFPDFMPTLAAIGGAESHLPQDRDGIDVSPLFFGKDLDTDNRDLYWEFPGKQRALRHGKWKCVSVKAGKALELYDIENDKTESHNLANEHPDIVEQMNERMKKIRTETPLYPIDKNWLNVETK